MRRNLVIVISVVALHGLLLWALQAGLLRRAAQALLPETVLVQIMAPVVAPPPPPPAPPPPPRTTEPKAPAPSKPPPVMSPSPPPEAPTPPAPAPLAVAPLAAAPTANASPATAPAAAGVANVSAAPSASIPAGTGNNPAVAPAAAPAPKVELPSSDAEYLNNPKPAYPAQSRRLMETGRVVVRVFIAADGQASQASIKQSSGFERLDQASMENALKWRYVPGKRDGLPQGMWFDVPFNWQLTR